MQYYSKRKNPFKKSEDDVDLTPMIDVVFLILIFFMITSTFVKEKETFKIELPKADQANKQKVINDPLTVSISPEGLYVINDLKDDLISQSDLMEKLKPFATEDQVVLVRGDKNSPFSSYVYLENVLNELKINKRSLVVKKGDSSHAK